MTPASLNLTITRGVAFGPIVITCYSDADFTTPVDLTTWGGAFAQVRRTAISDTVVLDLAPEITDAAAGEVTIPEISVATIAALTACDGVYHWDFILEDPNGDRRGPFASGTFRIDRAVTRPA